MLLNGLKIKTTSFVQKALVDPSDQVHEPRGLEPTDPESGTIVLF